MSAYETKQKNEVANSIMTGYYTAYYTNGGKKVKSPKELIDKMFLPKQSYADGLREIERIKKIDKEADKIE